MVEKLPTQFRKSPEISVNFSFEDIASGLGVIQFWGCASEDDGGNDYHLVSNQTVYSQPPATRRTGAGTTTIDFDTSPFNYSRTPKGTAHFSANMGTDTNTETVKVLVQLKHLAADGTTETNISSEITSQTYTNGGGGVEDEVVFLPLPITTNKVIKNGESLRMTVKLTTNGAGNNSVGHDPKDATYVGLDTTRVMTLLMPFNLPI